MVMAMSKKPYPSQTQERFIVRMPDGLRDRIAMAAKESGRSMNSEIVRALEAEFPEEPSIDEIASDLSKSVEFVRRFPSKLALKALADRLDDLLVALAKSSEGTDDDRRAALDHAKDRAKFIPDWPPEEGE